MPAAIADQVVEFFDDLFTHIFSDTFRPQITDVLRRKAVTRQVEESADAASQSLTRFFRNQQLTEQQVASILAGFAPLTSLLKLANISNPNVTPESVVEELLAQSLPIPKAVQKAKQEAVFRVALHSIVQVLMLVGPVMAEWQKLKFSSTFELPRRVLNRLNQISEQLDALGSSQQAAADERFELSYRDYLLQRFHRVEAGTVRMTTNLDVDLRELFVVPRVLPRQVEKKKPGDKVSDEATLMNLASARKFFGGRDEFEYLPEEAKTKKKSGITALEQIKSATRNMIVGAPGSGKSTFFEWLQLKIASADSEEDDFIIAGKQAIPLLLRVRQLDPHNMPKGAAMIEKATASRDRAALMPLGWLDRQMTAGRLLLMLDGLDETEPELRDDSILPWLQALCREYPQCRYLVSSRPVGYPVGALQELKFVECDLMDFGKEEIAEYTRHWCTAIRLARNEPEEEARREGEADGKQIVESFAGHPYINDLARNPLMLSAICLVNYFEGGQLPTDRAVLYRLCVEGLLHNWDQRRGIRSEFPLDEKLRVCREVALAMQADDRAEYEAENVREIIAHMLNDSDRAVKLLEHIRYRTGLLLERRPAVFAFAHLTFQEYLAACAIHEGNRLALDAKRLVYEHADGRWQEVIALFCSLAPVATTYEVIHELIEQANTEVLSRVLTEAYLSSGGEVEKDTELRKRVLERIACAPYKRQLTRFPVDEVASFANRFVCRSQDARSTEAFGWLQENRSSIDWGTLYCHLKDWQKLNSYQIGDLIYLLHALASDEILMTIELCDELYSFRGPEFGQSKYATQAEVAILGLSRKRLGTPGVDHAFLQILRVMSRSANMGNRALDSIGRLLDNNGHRFPRDSSNWPEFALLVRQVATRFNESDSNALRDILDTDPKKIVSIIKSWVNALEKAIAKKEKQNLASISKSTKATKRTRKKTTVGRKL